MYSRCSWGEAAKSIFKTKRESEKKTAGNNWFINWCYKQTQIASRWSERAKRERGRNGEEKETKLRVKEWESEWGMEGGIDYEILILNDRHAHNMHPLVFSLCWISGTSCNIFRNLTQETQPIYSYKHCILFLDSKQQLKFQNLEKALSGLFRV